MADVYRTKASNLQQENLLFFSVHKSNAKVIMLRIAQSFLSVENRENPKAISQLSQVW